MRTRWMLWALEAATLAVVVSIFYWQLRTLPNLQDQIIAGLENQLSKISRDAAVELSNSYSSAIVKSNKSLLNKLVRDNFLPANLNAMKRDFKAAVSGQKVTEAWVAIFVNQSNGALDAWEYKPPGRNRPDADVNGSWRTGTELTQVSVAELSALLGKYKTLQLFNRDYWASAPDSMIYLNENQEFQNLMIAGVPVYTKSGELKGFIFTKININYFEKDFISNFFETGFWEQGESREGLEKRHLQVGVFSTQKNRLVYNSIAFGKKEFEQQEALSGVNAWLSDYVMGVGFRNAPVERVGNSIYNRNRFQIFAIYIALILLVLVIFSAARRLAVLSTLKSEFVANVTHEIKTPLASIQLAADTLRIRPNLTEEQKESCHNIIRKETDRLQEMISSLLDFSKTDAGKTKFRFEKMDAAVFWEQMKIFVRDRAGANMGSISGEPPKGKLSLDIRAMEQVIWILIDNARKYSMENKQIDLSVGIKGKMFRLAIRDYGIGIASVHQQMIFDKFVRIGNVDVHNIKGYGIGLSLGKGIMKGHFGKIGVESELGKGSTFFILLPLED